MAGMDTSLNAGAAKLNEVLRRKAKQLGQGANATLDWWSRYAIKRFVASRLSGGQGALQRRTGNLARSFRYEISGKGLTAQTRLLTDAPYAKVQEKGGRIKPKRAKCLAIPVPGGPALFPSGAPRYPLARGQSLRQVLPKDVNFWLYKSPDGKLYLMGTKPTQSGKMSRSKRDRPQAWFKLQKSVTLRPRLRFREAIRLYVRVLRQKLAETARGVCGK